ncbi:MAG: nitronate monooxygenase [Deltaproteobacteria bacterium]|nr:nitronate monooxygenase [Deltaproteobacteria bacterium]
MIQTRFTERFGLRYPLMGAPMAMHSGGTLAAAVSKAGGLGSFGGVHISQGREWVTRQVELIRSATDQPFGVGFITAFLPMFEGHFQATLDAKTPVIALSFGAPAQAIARAKEAGAVVMCQIQTPAGAREALDGGADILVAQGNEAGGHTGTMNLLPLLAAVTEAYPDVTVLAAGGISSGRALAAVLAAGADGAWAGTAFLATPEAVEVGNAYKQAIVESDGTDTVYTRAYDVLRGAPWPEGIAERVRRNAFTEEWDGRDEEVAANRQELTARVFGPAARPEATPVLYGQGAAAIARVRPAAEVMDEICSAAERLLGERSGLLR